ncbi:superoxide dismutase [Cu-Zn] [Episyrphus balteatus]|uniref:superoxide dismutase [Cu-Zn] n=1 Tax=Episyrphus balteatus TaxID=286459 RepID=UPI0024868F11|nr:superoxide dismutase [Cu-Zn] [Episyrphus balteatus]
MILRVLFVVVIACAIRISSSQGLFDRRQTSAPPNDGGIKVINGKVKRYERLTVPILGYNPGHTLYYNINENMWQASATIVPDAPDAPIAGTVTFNQWPANNYVKLSINITGLPVGKHAFHIHTFGDVSQGCKSTGGHFPNNFIGNVDTKDDGTISSVFLSSYLTLFGIHGIIGRSIVIHSKPIDINNSLNAEVFSSSLQALPDAVAFQNEENSVGPAIACGVISITSSNGGMMNGGMMPPPPTL